MVEPPKLSTAREQLSRAEATIRTADGLFHLEEGLALLDEVIAADVPVYRAIAQNLASTYSTRICGWVKQLVETDPGLPEPFLEHLFKVVLAFDLCDFDLPADARSTKINLARCLIDRYYEGYSPAEKRKALQRLAEASGGDEATRNNALEGARER